MPTICQIVATGTVNLTNTIAASCFNSPSSRYPAAGPWNIISGQHAGQLVLSNINSGGHGGIVSFYGSPSNTRVDIPISTSATAASGQVNVPVTDTKWQFCYEGPSFFGFNYEIDSWNAPSEPTCLPGGGYCGFGTQATPAGTFIYYLTPALLDTWLVADGVPWLAPLFTAFWFTTVNAKTFCGIGPPVAPVVDLTSFDASLDTLRQLLSSIIWSHICQCVPGVPAPVPFPKPSPVQPTGWPTLPVFSCSNQDLCTTITSMQQQMTAMASRIGPVLELVQLEQRYRLPFAVIDGAVHSNQSGSGAFGVSRLIGMRVDLTTVPTGAKTLTGNPPYLWNMGWMSITNQDGFVEEKRITRTEQTWFPENMPQAATFEFFLQPGVVAKFTEIQAEP